MNIRQVTLSEVETDLQNLADQVGEDSFLEQKALYMEKVAIVDEEGKPLSADDVEVVLMPKMQDDEEEKAADDEDAEDKAEHDDEDKEKSMQKITINKNQRKRASTVAAQFSAPAVTRPKVWGGLKNFKDDANGEAVDKALRFGHWLMASRGNRKSLNFCDTHGIEVKAHTEGVNSAGGFLVPDEFETELISLREQYGVFRRNARVRPMSSDTLRVPRRSATLSANFVGEATAISESTQTFEGVTLVAKKLGVLTTISNELNEDAFVNLADDVAGEIAYAFAKKEDECGFIGDGTSTYGGINGVATALAAGTLNTNYIEATLTTAADITMADVHALMSLLPAYADTPNCKFYMHKGTWHGGFEKVAVASGGTSAREIQDGYRGTPTFFGYPVEFTQVMTSGSYSANNAVALFGDLSLAASFGDRRQTTVQVSDSALNAFEQDELAIRGTERFDINVHDLAPIVALRA
jgi:HK97 family phage major capsid protein